jgi:hypothetical protein
MPRRWESVVAAAALAASCLGLVAELAYFFEFGRYNIDEGMHLNAGRLIFSDGLLPYRDFPFSQGPGGPYFYGLLGQLFEPTLWVGRLGSLAAGLVCFGAMLAFAWRSAGVTAALGVALLLTLELPSLWLFTQIRTEAGSMALATLAALAFLGRRDTVLRAALPAVLLVGATAFRLTYVVALLAVVAITAFELRARPRRLAGVLVIVGATGLLAALPMLAFPDPSFFHLFVSQNTRAERLGWPVFPPSARFWFFTRPETGYHAVLLLLPLPLLRIVLDRRPGGDPERARALVVLLAAAALVYGPQLWFTLGFFQYFENAALLAILAIGIALAAFLQPTSALRTRTHGRGRAPRMDRRRVPDRRPAGPAARRDRPRASRRLRDADVRDPPRGRERLPCDAGPRVLLLLVLPRDAGERGGAPRGAEPRRAARTIELAPARARGPHAGGRRSHPRIAHGTQATAAPGHGSLSTLEDAAAADRSASHLLERRLRLRARGRPTPGVTGSQAMPARASFHSRYPQRLRRAKRMG